MDLIHSFVRFDFVVVPFKSRIEKLSLREDLISRLFWLPTNFLVTVMGTNFFTQSEKLCIRSH